MANVLCMVTLVLAVALLLATHASHASPIVNGVPLGRSFEYPYMVSMQMRNGSAPGRPGDPDGEAAKLATTTVTGLNHFCGGIYLSSGIVATAAHCVCHLDAKQTELYAVIGAVDLCAQQPKSERTYRVLRIQCKEFNPFTYENDIALLLIDTAMAGEPVPADQQVVLPAMPEPPPPPPHTTVDVLPVQAPAQPPPVVGDAAISSLPGKAAGVAVADDDPVTDDAHRFDRCYLIGYGSTQLHGDPTLKLLIGSNTRIPQAECAAKLGKWMAPEPHMGMFCAEGVGGDGRPVDTCQGDSGGPFLCRRHTDRRYEVVGLTSYGAGCGAPNTPGVYTSMLGHVEWIRGVVEAAAVESNKVR